jgi:hypothetical protein
MPIDDRSDDAATRHIKSSRPRTHEEIRAWLERLAQFSDQMPSHLDNSTFSREMIYEEHD